MSADSFPGEDFLSILQSVTLILCTHMRERKGGREGQKNVKREEEGGAEGENEEMREHALVSLFVRSLTVELGSHIYGLI